jgi:antitoxin component HigA of HigAB toxin-antitoxin module
MNISPIRTKADHKAAVKEIESLMSAKANTPEGDRLDVLARLVEAYERTHFPMDCRMPPQATTDAADDRRSAREVWNPGESLLKQRAGKAS